VARHVLQPGANEAVWDPSHRAAAEAIALAPHRAHLRIIPPALPPTPAPPTPAALLELGPGDYDVEPPDLAARYGGCGCQGAGA
jgi:hypothetical protein